MEDIDTPINAHDVQEQILPPSLPPTMPPRSPPPPPELLLPTLPPRPTPETRAPLVDGPSTDLITPANVAPSDGLSIPPPSPESHGHERASDSPERSTSPATTASPVTPISPVVIDFTSYRCSRPFGEDIKALLIPETVSSEGFSTDSESMSSGLIGTFFTHSIMDLNKDGQPTVVCLLCA